MKHIIILSYLTTLTFGISLGISIAQIIINRKIK